MGVFRSEADARLYIQRHIQSVLEQDLVASGVTPEEVAASQPDIIDLAGRIFAGLGGRVTVSTQENQVVITVEVDV